MNIVSLEEFNTLPPSQQMAVHREMKNNLGIAGILDAWGLSRNKYYYMVKKLQLNEDEQKKSNQGSKSRKNKTKQDAGSVNKDIPVTRTKQITSMKPGTGEKIAFSVSVQGSTQIVSTILETIAEMYDTSTTTFKVNMSVEEV